MHLRNLYRHIISVFTSLRLLCADNQAATAQGGSSLSTRLKAMEDAIQKLKDIKKLYTALKVTLANLLLLLDL